MFSGSRLRGGGNGAPEGTPDQYGQPFPNRHLPGLPRAGLHLRPNCCYPT